jgi:hypothetical protein
MPQQLLEPPTILWDDWIRNKAAVLEQGQHVLFCGPTQSGKTLLCRHLARLRGAVVVFGTKPVDPSLDAYVAEGYVRIDHWPPTAADYRKGRGLWADLAEPKFILWPKIKTREQLRQFGHIYQKAFDEIFIEGHWCIVVDEGLWISAPSGLGLGSSLADIAYGSASNKVSLYLLVQRQANVPPVAWTSVSWAEIFHMGRLEDIREMASLGIYPRAEAQTAVQRLRGHQFMDLPCRGGAEWSISQVDPTHPGIPRQI